MDSKSMPADIQNKIAMLEHHRAEIKRLKQLLEISEQQCRLLESDLADYRASVAPIRKCPAEILAAIFRDYLEDNPRHIRRLLLVCRLWYNLTLQTPDLWTSIPIIFDSKLEPAKEVVDSIKPRVVACIKYSQNLPLDIDLDLTKLCKTLHCIENQARIFEDNYLRGAPVYLIGLLRERWPRLEAHFFHTPWNSYHIFELLAILTGSAKENMKRWKTFSIALPEGFMDNAVIPIWDVLAGPLPSLVSLSINHSNEYYLNVPCHMVFTDLKSLQYLTLNDRRYLSCLDIIPATIRVLDFCLTVYQEMHDVRLSRFRFLRALKLRGHWDLNAPGHSILKLHFPELESIAFMGGILSTEGIDFKLPLLKHLYIQRSHPEIFINPPALSATSITWVIRDYDKEDWTIALKQKALKALLQRCRSAEMLTIAESTEDALLSVINDLEHTGELPPSLRTVRIASDPDVENIIRTRTFA
jgi:F-box-like